ncbi:hypothetical protein EJB06_03020 [Massilia atriviolacea]|uniref:ribose-phosphate diphosphokinase n=1 Tax=Massilia atriviolacea TaxID=2495579 RepID=A0A430HU56_9BURK|nr:hypothetical protein EJB06_03020 [Massilia atriviolacea]
MPSWKPVLFFPVRRCDRCRRGRPLCVLAPAFSAFAENAGGHDVLIVDDTIASGSTLARCARTCRKRGACQVYAVAAHGLITGEASRTLGEAQVDRIPVNDTVPQFRLAYGPVRAKLQLLACWSLLAGRTRRKQLRRRARRRHPYGPRLTFGSPPLACAPALVCPARASPGAAPLVFSGAGHLPGRRNGSAGLPAAWPGTWPDRLGSARRRYLSHRMGKSQCRRWREW